MALGSCARVQRNQRILARPELRDESNRNARLFTRQSVSPKIRGTVAAHSYQAYSEAELLDLRRRLESSLEAAKREKRDYGKRAGPGFWNNEGYREIEDKEKLIWNEISAIDRELAIRRRERGG